MTTTGLPPVIDYTSRDFAGFRESLLAHAASVAPEWRGAKTGDPNDFGVVLAEVMAYEGDVLSYYTDRIANESFLATAVQRQSVLNHAALLDYTPRSATAATVPVSITVTTTTASVTVPAGFKVSTSGAGATATPGTGAAPDIYSADTPITFETTAPLVFPASTLTAQDGSVLPERQTLVVIAAEGETVEDEVVGTLCGDPNDRHQLAQAPVISDSVTIWIVEQPNDPGQVWFRVGNLLDAGPNDNAYQLIIDADDSVTIMIGDGVNGRIPPRGSVMHARYRVGGGADGNVPPGDIIDILDPEDIRFDRPGDEEGGGGDGEPDAGTTPEAPTELTVINLEAARGGADSESLESIRVNAPRARRTNGRAVSLEDYETLALTMPDVQLAKVKAVSRVYTNVTLYVAPPGGIQPTQIALNAVVAYLLPRKMAGVTVVAASPTYVPVDVTMHVIVDSRFNQASVQRDVETALQRVLAFENVSFGDRVALSSIYAAAIEVQGVLNVQLTKLSRDGLAGAADILLADNELPLQGTLTLTAQGGIVNSGVAAGAGTSPLASTSPAIALLRCDPTSTHVELTWSAGASTTHWEVQVQMLAADGTTVVSETIAGPFSYPEAIFDLPRIGAGRATTIRFRTRAYNGNTGPVDSAFTSTPYTCE